jgi:hypothetical protein
VAEDNAGVNREAVGSAAEVAATCSFERSTRMATVSFPQKK